MKAIDLCNHAVVVTIPFALPKLLRLLMNRVFGPLSNSLFALPVTDKRTAALVLHAFVAQITWNLLN